MDVELGTDNYYIEKIKIPPKDDLSTTLDQSVKQILKREGFIKYEIKKRCISTNGGNYLGTLYEIDVKGKTRDGDKELNIFVKQTIDLESFKIISISNVFNSEMFAYKELSKVFEALQAEANIPIEERYKIVKAYEESNTESIIMENIAKKGYTTYFRMDVMPLKFVQGAIKQLAKFHALSFALKEKRPEYFDRSIKSIKSPIIFEDDWQDMVKTLRDIVIDHIDDEFKDIFEKEYENLAVKFAQYCSEESIKVCLCHGDYKINNIMVKIEDGEIQDMVTVDYQLMFYGCPIFDFLYFMYGSTDREFRQAHMTDLKNLYYESLTNFLKYFDLDAEMVYSRKEFEMVYKERLDYGLMIAMMFLPFFFAAEDFVPNMSQGPSDVAFQVDSRFKDRFRGVIEDFVEWGYI